MLQKRVLRFMYFSQPRAHAVPLFTPSKILPLNMLYVETVSSIMFDISCLTGPTNVSNLFIKASASVQVQVNYSIFIVNCVQLAQ